MLNNNALKSILNQKVAEVLQTNPASVVSPRVTKNADETVLHAPTAHIVTVSFSIPLEDAAGFLERVSALLAPQPIIKTAVATPVAAPIPDRAKERISPTSTERISDKQTAMILNLCKRKRMTAQQLSAMLQERFGVTDGSQLDKKQASKLIDHLMTV